MPKHIQVPVEPCDYDRMCTLLNTSRGTIPQMLRRAFYDHLHGLEALTSPQNISLLNPNQVQEYIKLHATQHTNPRP